MSFYEVDDLKIEKEKAMLRYRRFKNIASVARTFEFCFAVLFFAWSVFNSSAYFQAAFQLSGIFLRRLCVLVVSHHFVFLLGNLIIVILFVKSARSACSGRNPSADCGDSDDAEDYLIGQFVPPHEVVSCGISTEEMNVDDKHVIVTETKPSPMINCDNSTVSTPTVEETKPKARRNRRTRSQEFEPEVTEKQYLRSKTEPRRKSDGYKDEPTEKRKIEVEDLSNEEFQRKVEAFIERQQRFLRQESMSTVTRHRRSI